MLNIVEKSWNEFWAKYWRIDHLHSIPGIFDWDKRLVSFIESVCQLLPGMRILDLGCGGGDQAKVFASKGYDVVGIDIAPVLIDFARDQFKKEGLKGNFYVGDMRTIDYEAEFDACVILSGTFGFFSDTENENLLSSICRALKVGGKAFISFSSANKLDKRTRKWSEIKDGWEFTESWVDPETCTLRTSVFIITKEGVLLRPKVEEGYHAFENIRCYTIPELKAILSKTGLDYLASFSSRDFSVPPGQLADDVVRDILVVERPIKGSGF